MLLALGRHKEAFQNKEQENTQQFTENNNKTQNLKIKVLNICLHNNFDHFLVRYFC